MRCHSAYLIITLCFMVGCAPLVPATQPAQLRHTPGAFVMVDHESFDAGAFQVEYPQGWRIIKSSTAGAPMTVVFASDMQDDGPLQIWLSVAPLALTPAQRTDLKRRAEIPLDDGTIIYAVGLAPSKAPIRDLNQAFSQVVDSVRART